MKNNVYQTIQLLEKQKEYSLLASVATTRQSIERLNSSISSINAILQGSETGLHHSLVSQNNNDYRILVSHVSKSLEKQHTTEHKELNRKEFHLNRQMSRSKLIEVIIDKKQRDLRKKKAEREQSRLSDLLSVSRKNSIFK